MKWKEKKQREASEFVNALNMFSKVENGALCGKRMTSACNSHVVPQFLLKNIAEDGFVSYGFAFYKDEVPGFNRTTGIKNAYTFRTICDECDRLMFRSYENTDNLITFDFLDQNLKKQILCEMAIKAHLSHINTKYRRMVVKDMTTDGKLSELVNAGFKNIPELIDIAEHREYITF